jgi:hypothetical protein
MLFEGVAAEMKSSHYPARSTIDVLDWMQFIIVPVPIEQDRKI